MRLYGITNMYMSGIHAGIQTQHSTAELFVKYNEQTKAGLGGEVVHLWGKYAKTTIVLNGGMHDDLVEFLELMTAWERDRPYEVMPFAPFFEPGVNNAITSISVVMDATAVEFMDEIRNTKKETPEYEILKSYISDAYGDCALPVLEKVAFYPLAK